jgi:hypothetical protein
MIGLKVILVFEITSPVVDGDLDWDGNKINPSPDRWWATSSGKKNKNKILVDISLLSKSDLANINALAEKYLSYHKERHERYLRKLTQDGSDAIKDIFKEP